MKFTYNKSEKLKSEKLITKLFSEGKSVSAYPLRLVYLESTFTEAVKLKTGVSVPKRNFKKAVDRISIKRMMRETYRLHKHMVYNNINSSFAFMILYVGKEKPTYHEMESATKKIFSKFLNKYIETNK
ncbi:ribonuclease P protein component [Lacinutrix cladophorae]